MTNLHFYDVEFTDTFGGEANYCWVERYRVKAKNMKQAITKAKQSRYYSPIPKHKVSFNDNDFCRIDLVNKCICAFVHLLNFQIIKIVGMKIMKSKKSQMQIYIEESYKKANLTIAFMDMVNDKDNPLTNSDLKKLIARRPDIYGRFKNLIGKLKD